LDKLANPHLVFGYDNKDACDLAKDNGLNRRFFVFDKCNGEHKVYPNDLLPTSATDHRKEFTIATDFRKILEEAKTLDQEEGKVGASEDQIEWIHDELKEGTENYDPEFARKFQAPYKSNRFDMLSSLNNTKKKVQEELEEYKQKFKVDEEKEVHLQPVNYP
jgi:hypothetical protein